MHNLVSMAVAAAGRHLGIAAIIIATLAAWVAPARACSVPVFRYALERWDPSPYLVLVFHKEPLTEAQKAVVDAYTAAAASDVSPANLQVGVANLAEELQPWVKAVYERAQPPSLPWVVVLYPEKPRMPYDADDSAGPAVLSSGPLEADAVVALPDSPMRREIARRLLKGDSVVWILLECGDRTRDDAAAGMIEPEFRRLEKSIDMPLPEGYTSDVQPADAAGAGAMAPPPDVDPRDRVSPAIPMKLAFSSMRLSRHDPTEQVLVKMLLGANPEIGDPASGPALIAVFGRGRALEALTGETLNAETLARACEFLCGACSCEIKDLNPGTDLLMAVDWDGLLEGRVVVDKALPPLTGVMSQSPSEESAKESKPAESREASDPNPILRGVALVMAALAAAVVVAVIVVRRRGKEA